jgi:hypothetical protein
VRNFHSSVVLVWTIALVSCSPSNDANSPPISRDSLEPTQSVLATVEGKAITVAEFRAELERRAQGLSGSYSTTEQKRGLLEEMVRFEVLLAKAKAAGYDRDPEVIARVSQLIVGKFEQNELAKREVAAPVSDAEIKDFYRRNQDKFGMPESVRAAVIYLRSSRKATAESQAEFARKAQTVLAEAREADAAGFSRLAQKYSEDQATRYAGGETGWLTLLAPGRWDRAVITAAFAIEKAGDCAPLIAAPEGWFIVRLVERRPATVRPLDQVSEAIAYQLAQEKQRQQQVDFIEEMKRGLKIEMNTSLLEKISTPTRDVGSGPPPVPKS